MISLKNRNIGKVMRNMDDSCPSGDILYAFFCFLIFFGIILELGIDLFLFLRLTCTCTGSCTHTHTHTHIKGKQRETERLRRGLWPVHPGWQWPASTQSGVVLMWDSGCQCALASREPT